jgi:hypothetical protein
MRSAGNFSPEWGYLAPAPSFVRTARVVLVATAVGATAGAGVVLSLMDHSASDAGKTSVAARAIVTSVQAAPAPTSPLASAPLTSVSAQMPTNVTPAAQAKIPAQPKPAQTPAASGPWANVGANDANAASAPQSAAPGIAALSVPSSVAPSDLPDGTTVTPEMLPAPKKTTTTHHSTTASPSLGTTLRQIFSAHAGTSYYPSR